MHNYLGHLAAEDPSESQDVLPKAFVHTPAVERILAHNKCFVCGRRGAGKTALITMIRSLALNDPKGRQRFEACASIAERDFSELNELLIEELSLHGRLDASAGQNLEGAYRSLWGFVLDLLTCQVASDLPEVATHKPDAHRELMAYTERLGMPARSAPDVAARKAIDCIEKHGAAALPITRLGVRIKELRAAPDHRKALAAADDALEGRRAAITIDTMERYNIEDTRLYPARGLCQAVKDYIGRFKGVRCLCFLPAELTDDLFRTNLAKFDSYTGYLSWSYSDLLEFLARRYRLLLASRGDAQALSLSNEIQSAIVRGSKNSKTPGNRFWREAFWTRVCPQKVRNRLGWLEDSCAYLIRHTQKRPREILSCMDAVIEQALREGTFPRISEQALVSGVHDEGNLYRLLSDSLSVFHLPNLNVSVSQLAAHVVTDEPTVFPGSTFQKFAKRVLSVLGGDGETIKPHDATKILLRSGLIGRVRPRHDGLVHVWHEDGEPKPCVYYVTEFEYLIPGHIEINEKSTCAVHPILSNRLSMRSPDDQHGVVYPLPEHPDLVAHLNG